MLMDTREVQQVRLPEETEHNTTHSVTESGVQKSDRTDQNPGLSTFYCLSSNSKKQPVLVCLCVCLHVCMRPRRSNTLKLTAGSSGPMQEQELHCWAFSSCSVFLLAVTSSSCCKAPSKWTSFVICQEPKRGMFQDFHILSSQVTSARAGVLPKAFHRSGGKNALCHYQLSHKKWADMGCVSIPMTYFTKQYVGENLHVHI